MMMCVYGNELLLEYRHHVIGSVACSHATLFKNVIQASLAVNGVCHGNQYFVCGADWVFPHIGFGSCK